MSVTSTDESIGKLQQELERLRAENDELRARFRVPAATPEQAPDEPGPARCVIVLPDPLEPRKLGRFGPLAHTGTARALIKIQRERNPDVVWSAEHDLDRVPIGADCCLLADMIGRLNPDDGTHPRRFAVDRVPDADGPGRTGASNAAQSLTKAGREIRIVNLFPDREDGSDLADLIRELGATDAGRALRRGARREWLRSWRDGGLGVAARR